MDLIRPSLSDNHFIASWLQYTSDSPLDYKFWVSQTFDAGLNWSKPTTPIKSNIGEHGFLSVALHDNKALLVWIDETSHDQYAIQSATLDAQQTWSKITTLDSNSCSCCHTNLHTFKQQLLATYRHRTADEIRDIGLVKLHQNEWSKPNVIHPDNWQINGCPINGPVASSTQNHAAIAWFSAAQNKPRVQLKIFNEQQQSVQIIDDKSPFGYIDMVALDEERVMLSWLSPSPKGVAINLQSIHLATQKKSTLKQIIRNDVTGFPSIAVFDSAVFIAYESSEGEAKVIKIHGN